MSLSNALSRTSRYGAPFVALSLLSLSAVGCDDGASPPADDEHASVEAEPVVADTAAQGDEGTAAQGDEGAEEETDDRGGPRPIVSCAGVERARDPYRIRSRTVDGDVLTVVVTHSTGCRPHEFRLCYEPELLDTDPVQVNLRLDHDAHGERCQAIGRKVLEVDLGPLRDHYLAAHPNGESMVLNLGEPITYEL